MDDNDSRDLRLEQVIYHLQFMDEVNLWLLAVAMKINREMRRLADMRKTSAAYLIAALFLISVTGLAIFVINDNALMSAAFGGMLAFTIMVSLYYLVWRYLR